MRIWKIILNSYDFNNPSEKAIHDKLVFLTDRMLDLHISQGIFF